MKRLTFLLAAVLLAACTGGNGPLPRAKASAQMDEAFASYLQAVADSAEDLHSVMVLQHGKVLEEKFFVPDTAHILNSVSKTFTSTAVGFAISERLLHLDDKIVDLFPESVPENASDTLKRVTIRHLLTMNSGHGTDPTGATRRGDGDWVRGFMDEKPKWQESPAGINTGGWGLYLKTEDLARMGLCILNGGKFAGKQVIPADWVKEMSAKQVPCVNAGMNERMLQAIQADPSHPAYKNYLPENNDWVQGYGYQMWRCRHNAFRADGANGQYIIIIPEKDAVVVTTAHIQNMGQELNLIWDHLLPAL